jgi:tetratricopeptide (TPR) repeat protein
VKYGEDIVPPHFLVPSDEGSYLEYPVKRLLVIGLIVELVFLVDDAIGQVRGKPPATSTQIQGQVRYAEGPAGPQGMMVTLESIRGGVVGQTQTDSQGKFSFMQPGQSVFLVHAKYPGFKEVAEQVDLTVTPVGYVILELRPLASEQGNAVPPEGAGAKISAQTAAAPPEARKEFEAGRKQLLEKKSPKDSISHFQNAIKTYPSFGVAYLLMGTAYMDQKQWKDALEALEKAIQLDDDDATAHLALGVCHNEMGNFQAAEKPLLRGLELRPDFAEGHYELGRAYWALGRWKDAEPHALKATGLQPGMAKAHVLMGNILLRERNAPAALTEFKQYLQLDPNGPMSGSTKDLVARIEKALAAPR